MAAQERASILTELLAKINDNNAGEITPQDVRDLITLIVESFQNLIDDGAMIVTSGAPGAGIGVDGMAAFDRVNFLVYRKSGGAWDAGASIIGAQGAPGQDGTDGIDGEPGANGSDGLSVLTGSGAPGAGLGVDGQTYVDITNAVLYTKASGSWNAGVSLVGPQGPQGDPGADGQDGADGAATIPRYPTEGDLPASIAGDIAIVEDGPQLAIDDGAGGWLLQFFNAYAIDTTTKNLLQDSANFTNNVYSGSTAIDDAYKVPGMRHIDETNAYIEYLCIGAAGSAYWVKLDYSSSGGGDPNNLGYFATQAALSSAHPTPTVGQYAVVGEDALTRVCEVAGTWKSPAFDQYSIDAATIALLENEASWWGTAGPNMYDPAATAIPAADLVVGKVYVKADENLIYQCVEQDGSPVWIRFGNRIPVSRDISLADEGVDATTGIKKTTYFTSGDLVLTHIELSIGNQAHAGGSLDASLDDDAATIASISLADGGTYGSDSTGLPVTIAQGSKLEARIDALPATPGQGHILRIAGFLIAKKAGQGGGGSPAFDEFDYFDLIAEFDESTGMVTDDGQFDNGDGNTSYFVSKPNPVTANQGSANGNEIFANSTANHATGAGWVVVANQGIKLWQSELSIKLRMYNGSTENGLNHAAGEAYLLGYAEYYQGGMSENRRKKSNGPSDKFQTNSPHNWKHEDNYNAATDGSSGTTAGDVQLPWNFSLVNGILYFFMKMRDVDNQRYYQWAAPIVAGNTRADLVTNDTITQSTTNGQVLYLDTTGGLKNDSSNEIEIFAQEGTILRKIYYKKIAAYTFSDINDAVGDLYEKLCNTIG